MLVGAAAAVYPNLLVSTTDPSLNITVENARTGYYSLRVGLVFWSFGMALAAAYFIFIYRMFRGKVAPPTQSGGYL
jgi:cytochrome bd ubiquinol oxidase subunit II